MQTAVTSMSQAFAGLLGDSRRRVVRSAVNEGSAELIYGTMVKEGTGANGVSRMTAVLAALVVADTVFTAANASETFTATAHGLLTGDGPVQVSNAGGALPTGLVAATDYWVIKLTANTFKLATSFLNAMAGTNLLISTDGTGTQTLADTASTARVTTYTMKGILVHSHAYAKPDELGDNGLKQYVEAGLLTKGSVWVVAEMLPAKTDGVHVRADAFAGQIAGAFRISADAGTTYDIGDFSRWTGRRDSSTTVLVVADKTFTATAATDTLTVTAHGLQTGDGPFQVSNSGGGLPAGLVALTNYWIIATSVDTFKVATTLANALLGTAVDVTTAGTGTQTISDTASTVRTSWIAELELDMVNGFLATAG